MYAVHYRILFPRTVSEKELLTIKTRITEVFVKVGLSDATKYSVGVEPVRTKDRPLAYEIVQDHIHVLSPSKEKHEHVEWYEKLTNAISMMAAIMECNDAEFIIEYRTVSNRDIDIHKYLIATQVIFHSMYDGDHAHWNCPEEDKYFDSHSIHYRYEV